MLFNVLLDGSRAFWINLCNFGYYASSINVNIDWCLGKLFDPFDVYLCEYFCIFLQYYSYLDDG